MVKGLIVTGLLVLLCHQLAVRAHVLSRHNSASSIDKLKSLLQQFEEALAAQEDAEAAVDYEDRNTASSQSQTSPARERDREDQAPVPEESNTDEGLEAQRRHLIDLLLSTRSKNYSGCFGGRLDRIGSSSLGCNSMKG
ncbi:natriuretic peptides A [Trichomycterus rosablanca]|uniref:natriuretic peptides A n=1 Tax=Trichomycterus rosablanca TaxID=2290929 RepID=UPI002F350382